MCKKWEVLRLEIDATRMLSGELTNPASILLNEADIKAPEENLNRGDRKASCSPRSRLATNWSAPADTWENRAITSARLAVQCLV